MVHSKFLTIHDTPLLLLQSLFIRVKDKKREFSDLDLVFVGTIQLSFSSSFHGNRHSPYPREVSLRDKEMWGHQTLPSKQLIFVAVQQILQIMACVFPGTTVSFFKFYLTSITLLCLAYCSLNNTISRPCLVAITRTRKQNPKS